MEIGSVKENFDSEKRIAITPETVKKFINLGFKVNLEKNIGAHLGYTDDLYKMNGAVFYGDSQAVISNSRLILTVNCPSEEKIKNYDKEKIIVGIFLPHKNKILINELIKRNVKIFSIDLLPRIARAQSMDVLSSQANLAGYRAVIESFYEFEKAVPMMMTAAGTVAAAKVLVIGAGVAGLQAIATAKRLGAIVSATDIRAASRLEVESLGAKFLSVESKEDLQTKEGYAKEMDKEYKKKQENLLKELVKKNDIIICTALIPGKKAPRIITEDMVKSMFPGSVIFDLAAENGGNSAFSVLDKTNTVEGVKIIGKKNVLNKLPITASNLYAKNLFHFVENLYSKEKKDFFINFKDEIVNKTLIEKEL